MSVFKGCQGKKAFLTLALLCSISFSSFVWATASGETGMHFLKIGTGVRGIGMGEAYTAVANDLGALYWNPAGLSYVRFVEAQFMYNNWFQDITSQYASFSVPYRKKTKVGTYKHIGTFALSINRLAITDIQGYDISGKKTSILEASDMAVGLTFARQFYKRALFGVTLKHLSETLADESATSFAVDFGFLYKTFGGVGFGASAQNLGSKIKFIEEEGSLPSSYRGGLSYEKDFFKQPLTMAVDYTVPNDNDSYFGVGMEYWIKDVIAARAGYRSNLDIGQGLRAGIGLKTSLFQLDYAFAGFDDLGDTHRLSIGMRFGKGAQLDRENNIYNAAKSYYEEGNYSEAIIGLNKLLEINPGNRKALDLIKRCYNSLEGSIQTIEKQRGKTPIKKTD